jgi:predicted acyl esterase
MPSARANYSAGWAIGTKRATQRRADERRWLESHGRKKWEYFMQASSVARQHVFFDHFLRGTDNEVTRWPRVWMEAREKYYAGKFRAEKDWPIARTKHAPLHLDAKSGRLLGHRELDAERSTPEQPWRPHRRLMKLKPKEIVPVEIEIWPSSTKFLAGETLRLVVQGSDVVPSPQPL